MSDGHVYLCKKWNELQYCPVWAIKGLL